MIISMKTTREEQEKDIIEKMRAIDARPYIDAFDVGKQQAYASVLQFMVSCYWVEACKLQARTAKRFYEQA